MRRVRQWGLHVTNAGVFLVRAVPTIAVALLILHVAGLIFHLPIEDSHALTWESRVPTFARTPVEDQLTNAPGKHLVIVHYEHTHNPEQSWVSNDANIDTSRIVWAHDMGFERNKELIHFFDGRRVWLAYPDENPVRLSPYERSSAPSPEGTETAN
jgi:hypothetical protein